MSPTRTRLLTAVGALVVVFGAGVYGWHWSGDGRSELAGWIEASATIAAVLAAAVAAWYAAQALDRERLRDEDRDAEQRTAQAQEVAVWLTRTQAGVHQIGYAVQNASSLPIYGVRLAIEDGEGLDQWESKPIDVLPPGLHEYGMAMKTATVWARQDAVRREHEEAHNHARRVAEARGETIDEPPRPRASRVMISFADARGARWERDFEGRLKLIWRGDDLAHRHADEF